MAHAGGRPLKFQSVKELQEKIDAYFAECDPHWVEEKYWDYPDKEVDESLEPQPHGGALKRKHKELDYTADMVEKTRMVLTPQKPYLITGLALALDTTRETLLDYENGNRDLAEDHEEYDPDVPKFSDTIKKAKLKCQSFSEGKLFEPNATGPIFSLKNNYGWRDKTEQDITSDGKRLTPMVGLTTEELRKLASG